MYIAILKLKLMYFLKFFIFKKQNYFNYAPTKWGAYSVALVRTSVRLSVRPEILWMQLLLNRMADFALTSRDEQP
jgi:hypothetical protein